jgi:plastocyanin
MKRVSNFIRRLLPAAAALSLLWGFSAQATTHVVQFGGALGFTYSPSSFSAQVGDTVKWEGDFTMHPLSSTTIPATAASWTSTSGSTFSYVIKVAGTYDYHCDFHFSIGMTGSFTATGSGILSNPGVSGTMSDPVTITMAANTRNPAMLIRAARPETIMLRIYNLNGVLLATLVNRLSGTGTTVIPLDRAVRANGTYLIRVGGNDLRNTRVFQVVI